VLLRMNAPNLALYNTHGVGDKGGNPLLKRFYFLFIIIFLLMSNENRFLLFYLDIFLFYLKRVDFLLLVIHVTNSTRVIYLHALGSDYLLATNLLDLSFSLRRGRPI
jgi:hypothetical protein